MASPAVRFDLGSGIAPAQFARLASDFSSFVDLPQRWAERDAVRDATEFVRRQTFFEFDSGRHQGRENDAEATARLGAAEASRAELRVESIEATFRREIPAGPRLDTLIELLDEDDDELEVLARIAEYEPTTLPSGTEE